MNMRISLIIILNLYQINYVELIIYLLLKVFFGIICSLVLKFGLFGAVAKP